MEKTGVEQTGVEKTGVEQTGVEKTGVEKTGGKRPDISPRGHFTAKTFCRRTLCHLVHLLLEPFNILYLCCYLFEPPSFFNIDVSSLGVAVVSFL